MLCDEHDLETWTLEIDRYVAVISARRSRLPYREYARISYSIHRIEDKQNRTMIESKHFDTTDLEQVKKFVYSRLEVAIENRFVW